MKVMMISCDNPGCHAVDSPEIERPRSYVPPYGWLTMKGHFVGTGPSIEIEVCSVECLEEAVDAATARAREDANELPE